jgi:hypothetical protein
MSLHRWLALGALAMPLAAAVQSEQHDPQPLDPSAPTLAFRYESAFRDYHAFDDAGPSPDIVWRSTNDELNRADGPAAGGNDHSHSAAAPLSGNTPPARALETPPLAPDATAATEATGHGSHH